MIFVPLIVVLTGVTSTLSAQNAFSVIVHESSPVTSLTTTELSRIFLKKTVRWSDGQTVQPADQAESSSVRRAFSQAVHGRPVPAIKVYWQQQIFAGLNVPPLEKASDREVMQFVAGNPAAIGYVSSGANVGAGLRVVTVRGT
jgi:ABC-type phosphate transport system substrate-binding protein